MHGILLMNKPKDFTSHDVVAKMRGILSTRKIGHGGTLDPMATGVLPLFIGNATKAVDLQPDKTKAYRGTFRLGMTTDTQDITGKILTEQPVFATEEEVRALLPKFRGEISQVPPMFSAVHVDGVRLYDLARAGKVVERAARKATIFSLELIASGENHYTIDIDCAQGTYIRTLCHDIGEQLGCGATLTSLERTRAGVFSLADCHSFEEVQTAKNEGKLNELILPIEHVFSSLPHLEVTEKQAAHLLHGVRLSLSQFPLAADNAQRGIYTKAGLFLGIGVADSTTNQLIMKKNSGAGGSS